MKYTKRLLLPVLGLSMLSSAPIEGGPYISNRSMEGPFTIESNYRTTLEFHNVEVSYYCFIQYYYIGNTGYVVRDRLSLKDAEGGYVGIVYEFQFADRLTSTGMKLNFRITSDSRGTNNLWSKDIFIYPDPGEVTVNAGAYRKEDYVRSYYTFHFMEDGEVINEERISFRNTVDFLTNNASNILDLSELSFTYNEEVPTSYNAYLVIEDSNNYFPLITKDEDDYLWLPLRIRQVNDDLYFYSKNKLYYNPSTLEISLTRRMRFSQTSDIYLPAYIDEGFESSDIFIYIDHFGYTNMRIKIPLRFYLNNKYIGLCPDSNHCIIGGLKG